MTGIAYRENIIAFCKQKGPLLPADVARLLKTDTMRAGAMLSEMSENKILKISSLKVGGSPLYYLPSEPQKLEMYVGKLNEKDRHVFDILKAKGVLRDAELDTLTRVALRTLKDFAYPFHVSKGHEAELYWRFYTLSSEQALAILHPKPVKIEEKKVDAPVLVPLKQKPLKVRKVKVSPEDDPLAVRVRQFLVAKSMVMQDVVIITKKKELECIATKEGARFFCKAKDKKSISDLEVAAVFGQAAARKLPAFLLITGALSKKAQAAITGYPGLSVERM